MRSEVSLGDYVEVGVAMYRVFRYNGKPCVDVSSFYDETPFEDRATGKSISPNKALIMLQDQARTLSRGESRETVTQEDDRGSVAQHATAYG